MCRRGIAPSRVAAAGASHAAAQHRRQRGAEHPPSCQEEPRGCPTRVAHVIGQSSSVGGTGTHPRPRAVVSLLSASRPAHASGDACCCCGDAEPLSVTQSGLSQAKKLVPPPPDRQFARVLPTGMARRVSTLFCGLPLTPSKADLPQHSPTLLAHVLTASRAAERLCAVRAYASTLAHVALLGRRRTPPYTPALSGCHRMPKAPRARRTHCAQYPQLHNSRRMALTCVWCVCATLGRRGGSERRRRLASCCCSWNRVWKSCRGARSARNAQRAAPRRTCACAIAWVVGARARGFVVVAFGIMRYDAHGWRGLTQVEPTVSPDASGRWRRWRCGSVRHAELTSGDLVTADGTGDSSLAHDFLAKLSASSLLRLTAFLAGLQTLLVEVTEHPRFVDRLASKANRDAVAASSVVFCHAPPPALLQFLQSAPHAPSANGYKSGP